MCMCVCVCLCVRVCVCKSRPWLGLRTVCGLVFLPGWGLVAMPWWGLVVMPWWGLVVMPWWGLVAMPWWGLLAGWAVAVVLAGELWMLESVRLWSSICGVSIGNMRTRTRGRAMIALILRYCGPVIVSLPVL